MVTGGDSVPYQLPNTKSNSVCTNDFDQSNLWSEYPNSSRQQDIGGLP